MEEKYTWQRSVALLEEVYQRAIERRGKGEGERGDKGTGRQEEWKMDGGRGGASAFDFGDVIEYNVDVVV